MRNYQGADINDCIKKIELILKEYNSDIVFDDELSKVILVGLNTKEFRYIDKAN